MLGEALIDPHSIDGNAPGLGLLPLVTVFEADKTVRHTQTRFVSMPTSDAAHDSGAMAGGRFLRVRQYEAPGLRPAGVTEAQEYPVTPWTSLAGVSVSGYEIHHGQTAQHPAMAQAGEVAREVLPGGLGWQNAAGNVLGIYLHGLFEDPAALQALFGARLNGPVPTLDAVFDGLADYIGRHFTPGLLDTLVR
jgi:adenosylcobyric acid synthase